MISLLSIDANAPLIAMKFSMQRGTGKGNDLHFHLNRKERPSAPRTSHVRAEQKHHERHGDPTLGRSRRKLEPRRAQ
jgi:hypothetical protein